MQCINCDKPGVWLFKAAGVADRVYCNVHLPAAYRGTKNVSPVEERPATPAFEDSVKPEAFFDEAAEAVLEEAAAAPTVKRTRTRKPKVEEPVEEPVVAEVAEALYGDDSE